MQDSYHKTQPLICIQHILFTKALKEIWKYYNSSHQNNNNISLIPDETKSTSFLSFNADGDSTV